MTDLGELVALSRELGGPDYVQAGGGNTSFKTADTLWVKASGTSLAQATPASFVALDRGRLSRLYSVAPPEDGAAREALVKDMMEAARKPATPGRASVESPLHDSFDAAYVVHTHPALVNAMTCAQQGREACARLFPDAVWMEYVDPGFTICRATRTELESIKARSGRQPEVVFMKNHGVFVAAGTAAAMRARYAAIFDALQAAYRQAGVSPQVAVGAPPPEAHVQSVTALLHEAWGQPVSVAASGPFAVPPGPLTPDHIVYSKAFPYVGEPTPDGLRRFRAERGYWPQLIAAPSGVYGVAVGAKSARYSLDLALDGARVAQMAAAFGGVEYMTDRAVRFIDNWEVEAYRRKLVTEVTT